MADKSISELPQASQINNDDAFVLQQGTEARRLLGATLLEFLTLSVMSVTVTTLPAGSKATATYSKATGVLALGIPAGAAGAPGATGPANTLTIGSVTAGDTASANISGTAPEQTLNLVLPRGNPGAAAPTITGFSVRQSDYHLIVSLSDGTSYDAGYCRGTSGAGTGDMQAETYDPQGKNQDVFAYVDNRVASKLDKTGDGSNVTAAFSTASARANITTGEKLSVLFSKIAKWFADLGTLAFKNSVAKSDLAAGVRASLDKADSALQSAPVTSVNGKVGAVTVATPPSTTALLKGNGSGGMVAAVRGSDYIASGNITKQTLVNADTTPTANNEVNWTYG